MDKGKWRILKEDWRFSRTFFQSYDSTKGLQPWSNRIQDTHVARSDLSRKSWINTHKLKLLIPCTDISAWLDHQCQCSIGNGYLLQKTKNKSMSCKHPPQRHRINLLWWAVHVCHLSRQSICPLQKSLYSLH